MKKKPVHYRPFDDATLSACGKYAGAYVNTRLTRKLKNVTCDSCVRTRAWRDAGRRSKG